MPEAPLTSARIAVTEDDDELRELLVSELAERGFQAVGFASAEALYRHLAVQSCDIVLLDIGLPGEDGYAVARHLHQIASVGIVMLTARGKSDDMARGLSTGADLYLVKPVDMDVLAAGIASLRRRLSGSERITAAEPAPRWALVAGGWKLRTPDGVELSLGEAERVFLRMLFEQPGEPVDRERLIAGMTESPADFDPHRLEVLLHRLRQRVRAASGHALPLRAVRGIGYLWLHEGG
ncbi:response regulator transcription factor [Pseudomonas sp. R2.Fl]|nr:response regulator transcription factor [Pseudomonas sp. R2.Fl]